MIGASLHKRALGAGLTALGVASAIAVAVDADRPAAAAAAAVLGVAVGLGVAQARSHRVAPLISTQDPASFGATLLVLGVASLGWILIGIASAPLLDEAGVPKRSELFAFADGLVAAAGLVFLRSPRSFARN